MAAKKKASKKAVTKPKAAKAAKASRVKAKRAAPKARAPAALAMQTVTPYLAIRGAADAIEWYKKAFGATEISRIPSPGGMLMHADLRIGDSRLFISDVFPGSDMKDARDLGSTPVNLHLHSKSVDALWKSAVDAGAKVTMPLENQFWGDRYGRLIDPFGHSWALSFKAKMTKEEMDRKREEAMKGFESAPPPPA